MSASLSVTEPQRNVLTTEQRRKGALKAAETKRERSKPVRQRLAESAAKHVRKVQSVYLEAMDAEFPPVVETRKDGTVVERGGGPDHPTRIKAATGLLEQAFGRPQQVVIDEDGNETAVDPTERERPKLLQTVNILVAAGKLPEGVARFIDAEMDEVHPASADADPAGLPAPR